MFKKSLALLMSLFLVGCSNNENETSPLGIDPENPKDTANFIQESLYQDEVVKLVQFETTDGIEDAYDIGEEVRVFITQTGKIEQINFFNLEKEDIAGVLEVAGFPVVDSINNFLDENEDFHSTDVSYPNVMTQYHDVVLEVSAKSAGVKNMYGDKPFFLILFYDPEKIDFIKQFN